MKFFIAAATLIASAAAGDWSQSCKEAKLDVTNEVLSASCNVGDGKGTFADTSLDLNDCLKYEDKKIIVRPFRTRSHSSSLTLNILSSASTDTMVLTAMIASCTSCLTRGDLLVERQKNG
jgi:hypothetical protein